MSLNNTNEGTLRVLLIGGQECGKYHEVKTKWVHLWNEWVPLPKVIHVYEDIEYESVMVRCRDTPIVTQKVELFTYTEQCIICRGRALYYYKLSTLTPDEERSLLTKYYKFEL